MKPTVESLRICTEAQVAWRSLEELRGIIDYEKMGTMKGDISHVKIISLVYSICCVNCMQPTQFFSFSVSVHRCK